MDGATIVFDLDGTLVETAPDLIGSVNHVLAGLGLDPVAASELRPEISFGAAHMLRKALALSRRPTAEDELQRLYDTVYLPHYAANIAVESRPFPGLREALETARREGARLAVCTNKWEGLSRDLLARLDLLTLFEAVAGRDTFPVFKPDPGHLLGAIRLAGGDPARAVMVGDSETDIRTARAARVPVIGVTFGYTDVPVARLGPDALIDHYDDLNAVTRSLLAR